MLKLVYGDAAVTMKTVYKWFERFRNGCESVENEERLGHFNNRFEHEVSECKICSTRFDGQTKATAFVNFIGVA